MKGHRLLPNDVAIVLGAGRDTEGGLTQLGKDRLDAAVDLWRDGNSHSILVMGGYLSGWSADNPPRAHTSSAQEQRKYLLARDVPGEAILAVEEETRDTIGEAFVARRVIADQGWGDVALVTSDAHMDRAMYIFSRIVDQAIVFEPVEVACGERINRDEEKSYLAAVKRVFSVLPVSIPDPGDWLGWRLSQRQLYEEYVQIRAHFAQYDSGENEAYPAYTNREVS